MIGKDGPRTPSRWRLAVLVAAVPLTVGTTGVVADAATAPAPAPAVAVAQTAVPAQAAASHAVTASSVDRGRGRHGRGDRRGDRGGRGRECGLLAALLFGCR